MSDPGLQRLCELLDLQLAAIEAADVTALATLGALTVEAAAALGPVDESQRPLASLARSRRARNEAAAAEALERIGRELVEAQDEGDAMRTYAHSGARAGLLDREV